MSFFEFFCILIDFFWFSFDFSMDFIDFFDLNWFWMGFGGLKMVKKRVFWSGCENAWKCRKSGFLGPRGVPLFFDDFGILGISMDFIESLSLWMNESMIEWMIWFWFSFVCFVFWLKNFFFVWWTYVVWCSVLCCCVWVLNMMILLYIYIDIYIYVWFFVTHPKMWQFVCKCV